MKTIAEWFAELEQMIVLVEQLDEKRKKKRKPKLRPTLVASKPGPPIDFKDKERTKP